MADVRLLHQSIQDQRAAAERLRQFDGGGGDGYDPGMEARVKILESAVEKTADRLAALERDVAVIKSNYATKADVSEAKNSVIMWVVSAILLAQLLPAILKKFGM